MTNMTIIKAADVTSAHLPPAGRRPGADKGDPQLGVLRACRNAPGNIGIWERQPGGLARHRPPGHGGRLYPVGNRHPHGCRHRDRHHRRGRRCRHPAPGLDGPLGRHRDRAQGLRHLLIVHIDSLDHKPETAEMIPMRRIGTVEERDCRAIGGRPNSSAMSCQFPH